MWHLPLWYFCLLNQNSNNSKAKKKKKKICLKAAVRICFTVHIWFNEIQALNLFIYLFIYLIFWLKNSIDAGLQIVSDQ